MPDLIQPGEAHALESAPAELQPLAAAVSNLGRPASRWKDEGFLSFYTGVTIIGGAGEGWEDKLATLEGVTAVRLDSEHIAVRLAG